MGWTATTITRLIQCYHDQIDSIVVDRLTPAIHDQNIQIQYDKYKMFFSDHCMYNKSVIQYCWHTMYATCAFWLYIVEYTCLE